jgi:hypothetical protein
MQGGKMREATEQSSYKMHVPLHKANKKALNHDLTKLENVSAEILNHQPNK